MTIKAKLKNLNLSSDQIVDGRIIFEKIIDATEIDFVTLREGDTTLRVTKLDGSIKGIALLGSLTVKVTRNVTAPGIQGTCTIEVYGDRQGILSKGIRFFPTEGELFPFEKWSIRFDSRSELFPMFMAGYDRVGEEGEVTLITTLLSNPDGVKTCYFIGGTGMPPVDGANPRLYLPSMIALDANSRPVSWTRPEIEPPLE